MFRRKQDVDKHVASILSRKRDEKERQAQGFQIARLYYDIKEYSVAKRYLSGFLQVRENVPTAHQLMGEINEALGEEEEAIENYKRALNLGSYGSSNKQLVLKICELYCELGTDLERMKYWCDQCEKFYPKSDVLIRLKTHIAKASNGQNVENSKEMEELVVSELVNHPTDLKLRIKLLDLYLDSERYEEAYDAAISTDLTTAFMDRLSWFEHLDSVFQVYGRKFPDAKSDLVYNQHLLHILRNITYLSLGNREIDDCVQSLQRFDEQVKVSVSLACQEEEWLAMLREMKGQMFFLAGLVLLKRAQTGTLGWQEACQLCGACFLASRSVDPIDSQAPWFVRAPQGRSKFNNWWSLQSYDRLSQVGHMLQQFSQNDFLAWSRDIREKVMTAKGHQTVFTVLYKPQNLQSQGEQSFFYQALEMVERVDSKEPFTERLLIDIDRVASQVHAGSLRHLVWLCLQRYSYESNVQPNYHFNIFDNIQFSTKNIESGAAESLCQLDILVFLLATVQCAASAIGEKSTEYEEKKGRPSLLPVCLSRPLCSHDQEEWWSATYKFCTNSVKEDYSRLRRILIRGLETVRLIGPHGVSVSLMAHIARSLDAKIKSLKQAEYGARCPLNDLIALESRAVFYWDKAKQTLQKLQRNHHTPIPKNRMFKETGDMELPPRLVDKYLAEANFAISQAAMRDGKFELALEGFENHQSVWAKFYCAQIYKELADRETENDDQASIDKRQALVFKSRDYLFDVMDMLDGDKGHELNVLVSRELEDLETKIHDLELYNARNSTFRTPARSPAPAKSSSNTNGIGRVHSTPRNPLITSLSYTSNALVDEESTTEINQSLRDQSLASETSGRPRPSPERLDLQIKSLSYSQASLFKMVMDRNEELIMINGKMMEELRDNNNQLKSVLCENKSLMEELKTFLGDNRDMMKQIKTELTSLKPSLVPPASAQVSPAAPLFVSHMPTPAAPRGPFPAFAPQPPVVPMAYGNYAMNSTVPAQPAGPGPQYCPTGLPGMRSSNVGKYRPQSEDDEDEEEDLSNIDETSAMFRDYIDAEQSYTQYFTPEAQMLDLSHGARSGIETQTPLPVPPFQPRMSIPAGYFASALRGQTLQYAAASQTPGFVKPTALGPGFFSTPPASAIGPAGAVVPAGLRMPVALAPATPLLAAATPPVSVDSAQSPALIAALTGNAVSNVASATLAGNQGPATSAPNVAAAPKIFGNFSATSTPITTTAAKTSLFGLPATKETGKFSFGGLTFSSAPSIEAGKEQEKAAVEVHKPQPVTTKSDTAKPFAGFSLTSATATTKSDVKLLPQCTLSSAKTSLTPEKTLSPLTDQKLQGAVQKVPGSIVKSPAGGEQDHVEEYEPNVDFKPVIALPELVEKKTGEENEIELFVERCRLFRFDPEAKQWKERGVGELKILQSKDLVKFRIVMRREQIFKLCANHFLTADMKLTPMAASDRAWCYFANDFSEEKIEHEHLAVKFRTAEKAKLFQEKFVECCRQLKEETAVTSTTTNGDSRIGKTTAQSNRETQIAGDKSSVSSSSDSRSLSNIFKPKAGSWECGGCLVRNNEEVLKCPACGAAKPGSQPAATSKAGSQAAAPATPSLSEMFKPKTGSWECESCLVRNNEQVLKCLACGAAKPGSQPTAAATPSLSEMFKPKAGSWECELCLVRNNADVVKCVACDTLRPGAKADSAAKDKPSSLFSFSKAGPAETGFKFGAAATTTPSQPTTGGFTFKTPAATTSSTTTFKFGTVTTAASAVPPTGGFPFKAPAVTAATSVTSTAAAATSTTTGGFFFKPTSPAALTTATTAMTTTASIFKPGFTIGASTPASIISTVATTTTTASGFFGTSSFSFSPAGKTAPSTPGSGGLLAKLLTSDDSAAEKVKPAGFNFTMPAKTPTAFGAADTSTTTAAATTPGAKGFQFSFTKTPPKAQVAAVVPSSPDVDEHGMYVNKEGDDSHIHFEPVVNLPEKIEVKTGEEDEDILFESRGKLYRFVSSEWKEKGVGVIKILQHKETKKTRLLMRRDQVLKICCNHIIEPSLNLQPMAKSEGKAWVWYALDFSEDEGKMEQLAVKFRTVEIAAEFKKVFDQCRDSTVATPQKEPLAHQAGDDGHPARKELFKDTLAVDSSVSDDVIFVGEDTPTEAQVAAARKYQLPDNFYLYENKPPCPGCIGCEDGELPTGLSPTGKDKLATKEKMKEESTQAKVQQARDAHVFGTSTNLPDFASLTSDVPAEKTNGGFVFGSGTSLDFSSLASSGKSSNFSWNTATPSGPFKFAGAGQKLFGGGGASPAGRDDDEADGEDTGVVPSDDIHFEPVIPLPELVKVKTGEEDWMPLFCHRAKLYKFDKQLSQWKERGVGDIKILGHNAKPMFRILQRREQVLKVSCNHLITTDMEIKPMATSETSWCWIANDLTESEPSVEKFAVKFKTKETADEFKTVFEKCQEILRQINSESVVADSSPASNAAAAGAVQHSLSVDIAMQDTIIPSFYTPAAIGRPAAAMSGTLAAKSYTQLGGRGNIYHTKALDVAGQDAIAATYYSHQGDRGNIYHTKALDVAGQDAIAATSYSQQGDRGNIYHTKALDVAGQDEMTTSSYTPLEGREKQEIPQAVDTHAAAIHQQLGGRGNIYHTRALDVIGKDMVAASTYTPLGYEESMTAASVTPLSSRNIEGRMTAASLIPLGDKGNIYHSKMLDIAGQDTMMSTSYALLGHEDIEGSMTAASVTPLSSRNIEERMTAASLTPLGDKGNIYHSKMLDIAGQDTMMSTSYALLGHEDIEGSMTAASVTPLSSRNIEGRMTAASLTPLGDKGNIYHSKMFDIAGQDTMMSTSYALLGHEDIEGSMTAASVTPLSSRNIEGRMTAASLTPLGDKGNIYHSKMLAIAGQDTMKSSSYAPLGHESIGATPASSVPLSSKKTKLGIHATSVAPLGDKGNVYHTKVVNIAGQDTMVTSSYTPLGQGNSKESLTSTSVTPLGDKGNIHHTKALDVAGQDTMMPSTYTPLGQGKAIQGKSKNTQDLIAEALIAASVTPLGDKGNIHHAKLLDVAGQDTMMPSTYTPLGYGHSKLGSTSATTVFCGKKSQEALIAASVTPLGDKGNVYHTQVIDIAGQDTMMTSSYTPLGQGNFKESLTSTSVTQLGDKGNIHHTKALDVAGQDTMMPSTYTPLGQKKAKQGMASATTTTTFGGKHAPDDVLAEALIAASMIPLGDKGNVYHIKVLDIAGQDTMMTSSYTPLGQGNSKESLTSTSVTPLGDKGNIHHTKALDVAGQDTMMPSTYTPLGQGKAIQGKSKNIQDLIAEALIAASVTPLGDKGNIHHSKLLDVAGQDTMMPSTYTPLGQGKAIQGKSKNTQDLIAEALIAASVTPLGDKGNIHHSKLLDVAGQDTMMPSTYTPLGYGHSNLGSTSATTVFGGKKSQEALIAASVTPLEEKGNVYHTQVLDIAGQDTMMTSSYTPLGQGNSKESLTSTSVTPLGDKGNIHHTKALDVAGQDTMMPSTYTPLGQKKAKQGMASATTTTTFGGKHAPEDVFAEALIAASVIPLGDKGNVYHTKVLDIAGQDTMMPSTYTPLGQEKAKQGMASASVTPLRDRENIHPSRAFVAGQDAKNSTYTPLGQEKAEQGLSKNTQEVLIAASVSPLGDKGNIHHSKVLDVAGQDYISASSYMLLDNEDAELGIIPTEATVGSSQSLFNPVLCGSEDQRLPTSAAFNLFETLNDDQQQALEQTSNSSAQKQASAALSSQAGLSPPNRSNTKEKRPVKGQNTQLPHQVGLNPHPTTGQLWLGSISPPHATDQQRSEREETQQQEDIPAIQHQQGSLVQQQQGSLVQQQQGSLVQQQQGSLIQQQQESLVQQQQGSLVQHQQWSLVQQQQESLVQQQQGSLVQQQQGYLVQQQQTESAYKVEEEEDQGDDEDYEEEDEEDDEEDDDDGTEVLYEKRVTLSIFEDGKWKKLGTGSLQVTYNEDLNGNCVQFIGDDNVRQCSHVICREHSIQLNQRNCEWKPIDFSTDEPLRKHFMATFSSGAAAEEFVGLFNEGQRLAVDSEISETLPGEMDPVIFSSGESVHKG